MGKMISYFISGSLLIPLTVSSCVNVSKTGELKHTAWIPTNSQLLKQPVDLRNCLDKEQHLIARHLTVKGIGIILHPNSLSIRTQAWKDLLKPDNNLSLPVWAKTEVGISVVPYVTDSSNRKFMLLPKLSTPQQPFNKFVPACRPGVQELGETLVKMPYYYPTLRVKVIPEQRDNLIQLLHQQRQIDCRGEETTTTPIVPSQSLHNKSLELFLAELVNKPEIGFLSSFTPVQEISLDETPIKLQVGRTHPIAVIPNQPTTPAIPIQIQLTWPKELSKLAITGCEAPQEVNLEYLTTCSFQAGQTYSIGYHSIGAFQTEKTYRNSPPFLADTALRPVETSRRLIVVSLAADFNHDGTGKVIQNSLYNYFKQYQLNSLPFTLLTIGPGRQLSYPILSSEELPALMAKNDSDALKERIKQLQFSATDLNALDDLELVDFYILNRELPISEIVYITNNMGIPRQLPRKQLGVPLAWHQEGIQLSVLTTNDCTLWNERALARCTIWQDKQQPILEKFLTRF